MAAETYVRVNNHLAGLALLGVMLGGLWQTSLSLSSPGALDLPLSLQDVRDGTSTTAFGRSLDQHLPIRETLIATANAGRYLITRGAGDQVRLGRDGWLFLADELRYDPQADRHQALRLALMRHTHQALAQMGVGLLIVLVPDKARLYAGQLSEAHYPQWNAERYSRALDELRRAGVPVVDLRLPLTPVSGGPATYYRTDTHWNQAGAQSAAEAIAAHVQTLGLTLPVTHFETQAQGAEVERVGDLLRMMGLAKVPNALRPQPDLEVPVTTQAKAVPQLGLFGDGATVPVVLAGTSYSLRGHFHGYLQQALQVQVLNTARDGGGFIRSINEYLTDDAFRTSKPQLLIWEIPERVLTGPLDPQEQAGIRLP